MYIAILAGGVGSRLWPSSRRSLPKQFTDITGSGRTLIQSTVERISPLADPEEILIITGERYRELAREQLPQIPDENILAEPSGRNTAPAVGLAAVHVHRRDPQAIIGLLHADHVITDDEAYLAAVARAADGAQTGRLTLLGIPPTMPHTGYGYIQSGARIVNDGGELPILGVQRFLEKPNLERAVQFLEEGGYYWNAGNFISRVDLFLEEFARQLPQMHAGLFQIQAAIGGNDEERVLEVVWPTLQRISIDHGIVEGAENLAMVPLDAGWNDVGSWDALADVLEADEAGNILIRGDTLLLDCRGTLVSSEKRLLALIGVSDLVVVDTDDALLIGRRDQMQRVKEVGEELRRRARNDLL